MFRYVVCRMASSNAGSVMKSLQDLSYLKHKRFRMPKNLSMMAEDEKIRKIAFDLEARYAETSGEERFIYSGRSMSPILHDGDCLATIHRKPLKFFLGDLVVYRSGENFIVHRFLCYRQRGRQRWITTKADHSVFPDPFFPEDCCVGKVFKIFRSDIGVDVRGQFSLEILHVAIGFFSLAEGGLASMMRRCGVPVLSVVSLPRLCAVAIGNYVVEKKLRKASGTP